MPGKHRRTRCDNCKRLFQFGAGAYKVAEITITAINKQVYCSPECAIAGIEASLEVLRRREPAGRASPG